VRGAVTGQRLALSSVCVNVVSAGVLLWSAWGGVGEETVGSVVLVRNCPSLCDCVAVQCPDAISVSGQW
jgi:hypothetical protein